jgi:hypothetical protein
VIRKGNLVTYPVRVARRFEMAEAVVDGVYKDAEGVYLLLTVHRQGAVPVHKSVRRVRRLDNVVRL